MISKSLQQEIQLLEDQGYIILLKWDGEREEKRKTVVITHHEKGISLRLDGDDITSIILLVLDELKKSGNGVS